MRFRLRALRGLGIIAAGGQVARITETNFKVKSSESPTGFLNIRWNDERKVWSCECKDFLKRQKKCEHIFAVGFLLSLPAIVYSNTDTTFISCPNCGADDHIVKRGFENNKTGLIQDYWCKKCDTIFPITFNGESGGINVTIGILALDLHFRGVSVRNICGHLYEFYGIRRAVSTIQFWISKFTKLLSKLAQSHKVNNVGDDWLCDEMFVKIRGKKRLLWNVLDAETRKLIVSKLLSKRGAREAYLVLEQAILKAGKKPEQITSDGLESYSVAAKELSINHVGNVALKDKVNNNKIESLHSNIRGWIRSHRGIKDESDLLAFSEYYNDIRSHLALSNFPPSSKHHRLKDLLHADYERKSSSDSIRNARKNRGKKKQEVLALLNAHKT